MLGHNPPPARGEMGAQFRRLLIKLGVLFVILLAATQVLPRVMLHAGPNGLPLSFGMKPPVSATASKAAPKPAPAPQAALSPAPAPAQTPQTAAPAVVPPPAPAPAPDEALAKRLDALSEKVDKLTAASQTQAQEEARIAKLEETVAQLQQMRTAAEQKSARLHAYDALKDAVNSGAPYREALEEAKAAAAQDAALTQALSALDAHADSGVTTDRALKESLSDMATNALHPPLPASAPWWRKVAYGLSRLVTIRRVGTPQGVDDASILARAETDLGHNDAAAALKQISAMSAPAQAALSGWRAKAQARAEADEALLKLRRLASQS